MILPNFKNVISSGDILSLLEVVKPFQLSLVCLASALYLSLVVCIPNLQF